MSRVALITGITGQVGSYLAEHLLKLGYEVHGIIRRNSEANTERLEDILDMITLHYGDITDLGCLIRVVQIVKPNEIYNLAAQSHVKVSDELEEFTMQVNTIGVLNVLIAIKVLGLKNHTRVLQASTSEMYGNSIETEKNGCSVLNEESVMKPVSIYGISKLAGFNLIKYYREAHRFFACNSISFNHESERRGKTFVTRKITEYIKEYMTMKEKGIKIPPLSLGNLEACRDWCHVEDIIKGMVQMLNREKADDYVLASGVSHSVRQFVELGFKQRGHVVEWSGSGLDEKGMINGETVIKIDAMYYRSIDINNLVGDATKAKTVLGWENTITFEKLVERMVSDT
jgi:GDPmannose 4,6-dehydratase